MRKLVAAMALSLLVVPSVSLAGKALGKGKAPGLPKVPVCHFGYDEDLLIDTRGIVVISSRAVAKHLANHSNSLGSDFIVTDEICGNGTDEDCDGIDAVCP